MKFGIIGAMDIEVDGIKKNIESCKEEKIGTVSFCYGKIFGNDIVAAKCGEGKVNSAMTAQTMILNYNPDVIINTGGAGALGEGMSVMDVVIADDVCQHDFDISPLGYEKGYIPQVEDVKIKCDGKLSDALEVSAKNICDGRIYRGTIATGDVFVASKEQKDRIVGLFGAVSAEMEGGSIGQVCCLNNKKFCVLRVMSDNADGEASMSFPEFAAKAADVSVNIILDLIKNI